MDEAVDGAFCRLGADAVGTRLKRMRREIESVRSGRKREAIHDLRVASRRLRTALVIFEPCLGRPSRRWQRQVRAVTRGLGRARDLEVQIEFLVGFVRRTEKRTAKLGLRRLLTELKGERRVAQGEVAAALGAVEASGVLEEIERAAERVGACGAKRGKPCAKTGKADGFVYRYARARVGELLEELCRRSPYLSGTGYAAQQHAMRIAAKRLRYALEVLSPAFGEDFTRGIAAARELQTLLGEVHDGVVWDAVVTAFETQDRRRDAALAELAAPGLEELRRDRERARVKVQRRAKGYWRRVGREEVWEKLLAVLEKRAVESAPGK
jgi:CHAD domain-containing protein